MLLSSIKLIPIISYTYLLSIKYKLGNHIQLLIRSIYLIYYFLLINYLLIAIINYNKKLLNLIKIYTNMLKYIS